MTTVHHSPPPGATPFAIYEDPEDQEPPSPSEVYEGDVSFNSDLSLPGADEAIPSVEHEHQIEDEPQPYKSSYTSRPSILSTSQSRHASGLTTTSFISSLPSEISIASKPAPATSYGFDSTYTPRKERPPFRNPSSVRAMQMASPPPFTAFESPRDRLKGPYKLATPSRSGRSETPVSASGSRRSGSHRQSHHRESQADVQQSPRPTPTPQQHLPLVLLHVTILPMQIPYPHELMVKAMPGWLLENYRLLAEKLEDLVLMRRGMLIPHPREEYDVLEETILESLELKVPRLLKCGHYVGPGGDTEDTESSEDDCTSVVEDGTGRGSRMSGGTLTVDEDGELKYPDDASICTDCHRQVKRPGKGIGSGTKRWDIKIYAANGLMRAGAWSAAWRDMERCDVEISPWIPEDVRKAMESKAEEEQEAERRKLLYQAELQRRVEEEATLMKQLEVEVEEKKRAAEEELRKKMEAEEAEKQRRIEEEATAKKRFDDTLDDRIEEAKESIRLEFETQALIESDTLAERFRALEEKLKNAEAKMAPEQPPIPDAAMFDHHERHQSRGRPRSTDRRPPVEQIPLGTLLSNYVFLLAQDRRNIAIGFLSVFVVFLAMHMNPSQRLQLASSSLPSGLPDEQLPDPVSQVFVTTTATMTATSISTTTITQAGQLSVAVEAPAIASLASPQGIPAVAESLALQDLAELSAFELVGNDSPSVSANTSASGSESAPESSTAADATQPGPGSSETLPSESLPSESASTSTIVEEAHSTPTTGEPNHDASSEASYEELPSIASPDSDSELVMVDLDA